MSLYAKVALFLPIDQLFTYSIPYKLRDKLELGSLVHVPLGNRTVVATVVNVSNHAEIDASELKQIKKVLYPFPVFESDLLKLTQWISEYYFCSWGEALRAASPAIIRKIEAPKVKYKKILNLLPSIDEIPRIKQSIPANSHKQILLLEKLMGNSGKLDTSALRKWGIPQSSVNSLVKKGIIEIIFQEFVRSPYGEEAIPASKSVYLTDEQQVSVARIKQSLDQEKFNVFLLYGVTGSGKTQVYIEAVKKTLSCGKTAIVLVPEISLTHQTVRRLRAYFPDDIAVFHSNLSDGERFDAWRKTKEGEFRIVIGARSAIFAPLENLGLIVVDEEHEASYKQSDSNPKYHARDVAVMRAKFSGATVVLGSATPSLESMHNAELEKYKLLMLSKRVEKRDLPLVEIVDTRRDNKGFQIFTKQLEGKIYERLLRGEQTILFLNRRGFSSFVLCKKCGNALKCRNCDISLTYHRHNYQLLCHYCDYKQKLPEKCPECGSEKLDYMGFGTQKVEEELNILFPKARILRMDFDTTSRKGTHDAILQKFGRGEADILLGTQMIAKGLDFPNVTLVGVLSADISLNIPDFRASERTFQVLSQVSGRAGRGDLGGEVIVQTMLPKHYSVVLAKEHDYNGFYDLEKGHRKELAYPPFTHLVRILLKSNDLDKLTTASEKLTEFLQKEAEGIKEHYIRILGPASAPLSKIKTFFRYHILLKSLNYKVLHRVIQASIDRLGDEMSISGMKIEIDVDCQDII